MKVIAIATGFDGLCLRTADDKDEYGNPIPFEMPDGATGEWFKPFEDDTKGPKAKGKAKSDTDPA